MRYMKSCVGLNFKIHSLSLPLLFLFCDETLINLSQEVWHHLDFLFLFWLCGFFWPSRNSICATCLPSPNPVGTVSPATVVRCARCAFFFCSIYIYIYYALCCSLALWVYRFSAFSVPLRVNNFVNWKQILRAGSRTRGIAIASQPSQPAGCETNSVHKKTPGSNRCDQTLYPEL